MRKIWVWAGGVGLVAVGIACSGELTDTVYFNDPAVDFGAPPSPLTIGYWGEDSTRPTGYPYDWRYEEDQDKRASQVAALEKQVQAAIGAKNFALAKQLTESQLKLKAGPIDTLRDRQLVLSLPFSPGLSSYLAARATEKAPVAKTLLAKIPAGPYTPFANYYLGELSGTPTYFEKAASVASPIRGRALMMSTRSLIASVYPYGEVPKPNPAALTRARGYIKQLSTNPAYQRFAWSAQGWDARVDFAQKKYGVAAVKYLDLLNKAANSADTLSATSSLRVSLNRITAADAAYIRKSILAEPALFEPYAAYRINHSEEGYDEKKPAVSDNLSSLAKFGQQVLAANPSATISSGITARLAEIAYQTGDYATAQSLADKALTTPNGERQDLARYVAAGARFRQKNLADAVTTLGNVPDTFKGSYLLGPANELKALCQQEQLDFAAALDTYRQLDYKIDIAYLLDVRMSPDQIRAYRDARPNDPRKEWLTLALGFRLLRENKLAEAESEFSSIPEATRKKLAQVGDTDYRWNETPGIDVIPDPLKTTQDLIKLRAKTDTPADLYALASYYYNKRNLLLYNAALWEGQRQVLSGLNTAVTTKEDRLLVIQHCHEHECLYVARGICLEIAKRFPTAAESSKALYRAATASRRLADFNEWWRQDGTTGELYASAIALMKRCAAEFPNEPLAANARKYAKAYLDESSDKALQSGFGTTEQD